MKISIKKAGIFIGILVVIVLSLVACLSVAGMYGNIISSVENSNFLGNVSGDSESVANSVMPKATKEIILDCSCAEESPCTCGLMASLWSEANLYSISNNVNVNVILNRDWLAADDAKQVTSFGPTEYQAKGIREGRIAVENKAKISLDLNGHILDRKLKYRESDGDLTNQVTYKQGNVIIIMTGGELDLYDSSYDAEAIKTLYEQYKDDEETLYAEIKKLNFGKITGGASDLVSLGGGINVNNSTSKLTIHSAIVTDNYGCNGGAIGCAGQLIIENALIFDNTGEEGGTCLITGSSRLSTNGGYFMFNRNIISSNGGGTIVANTSDIIDVKNSVIAYNQSQGYGGGIDVSRASCTSVKDSEIIYNSCAGAGGGIKALDTSRLYLGGEVEIYGNTAYDGLNSDIWLKYEQVKFIEATKLNTKRNGKKIYVRFTVDNDMQFKPLTFGYGRYCEGADQDCVFATDFGQVFVRDGEVYVDWSVDSKYDYMYLENGKRQYYKDNNILHGYNDKNIVDIVLGNISPNTSVNEFVTNLTPFGFYKIKLYNCVGKQVYGEGADNSFGSILDNALELSVGTGWKLEVYALSEDKSQDVLAEEMYLSVLGDITGDGKVNTLDVNLLRRIVVDKDNEAYAQYFSRTHLQLAMLIVNNGNLATIDCDMLWSVVSGKQSFDSLT